MNANTNSAVPAIAEILKGLEASKFYGSMEIKYECGHVTVLRKMETLKLTNDHRDNRGNSYGRTK